MSQIGYMIMGVGVGAYEGGVAHFFTHAFFKAQLFLGGRPDHSRARQRAGRPPDGRPAQEAAVRVRGDSDAACSSICGIPGFSGFFTKDEVIYGALEPAIRGCTPSAS